MLTSKLAPPSYDQETVDMYVAKGRRARSRAFAEMLRALFTAPERASDALAQPTPGSKRRPA